MRDALARAGFEVESAPTATEAVELLAGRRYAVIVADCVLPDLPALDWLAALHGAASATPLILLSGGIGPDELAGYAAEFGAVAVLQKPFSIARLVEPGREVPSRLLPVPDTVSPEMQAIIARPLDPSFNIAPETTAAWKGACGG